MRCLHLFSCLLALSLAACADPTARALRLAARHDLASAVVEGTHYRHRIFFRFAAPAPAAPLFVFIEGDGSPWTPDGARPAADPTPHRALTLELAARMQGSVLYVGRPCYFAVQSEPACSAEVWTSARYSEAVVASMVAVVNRVAAQHGFRTTVLVGYSGGGTLAVLMAPRLTSAGAVITIAADLDVDAWTQWHGYLPLSGSLNPAMQAPLARSIRQVHLVGGQDRNVPEVVNSRYFQALAPGQIWRFPTFDHVCCWVEAWPGIVARLNADAGGVRP